MCQRLAHDIDQYKALGDAQARMAIVHSGAYRTLAILNSLDEAQVKAFATAARQQLEGLGKAMAAFERRIKPLPVALDRYAGLAQHPVVVH